MQRVSVAAGFACLLAASAAFAQSAAPPAPAAAPAGPHRVRGVIAAFDGQTLTVTSDDGQTVTAGVLPVTRIIYDEPRKLSDIHQGDFVGSAALKGADGKLHAQEVHIFPESLRGTGEGQYEMADNNPNRSMTNATVMQVTGVSNGAMTLSYHGAGAAGDPDCTGHAAAGGAGCIGTAQIEVAPGIPVIGLEVGDTSMLVPGAAVSMVVTTGPAGTPVTPGITVEHNGVKPF